MEEEELIFHRKKLATKKRQITNNDFTPWKAARKLKRPSMLDGNVSSVFL